MHRVTMSLDTPLAEALDALVAAQGYASRSEAIRDLVRGAVDARALAQHETGNCIANLSYVYDHHARALTTRLIELQHARHELVVSTTHIHLDHDTCLESIMLRGPTATVRRLADQVCAERGVRFGSLNLISENAALAAADVSVENTPVAVRTAHSHA